MALKNIMLSFSKYTEELILAIKNEKIDDVTRLLNLRQGLIKEIDNELYSEEEIKKFIEEYRIIEKNSELQEILKFELEKTKKEIANINATKNANRAYNNQFYKKNFFSEKI